MDICESFLHVLKYVAAFITTSEWFLDKVISWYLSLEFLSKLGLKVKVWYCSGVFKMKLILARRLTYTSLVLQWILASFLHLSPHCIHVFAHAVPSVWSAIPAFTIHVEIYTFLYLSMKLVANFYPKLLLLMNKNNAKEQYKLNTTI